MATRNHVVVPNFPPTVIVGYTNFSSYWKLTRAMKKAGWKYLASGNGTTFNTSADPELDLWGSGTISNVGASSAAVAAPSRGRAAVTGLTGIVAQDKGRFLHLSGSGTPANNHYHQIEEVLSPTSVSIDARTFAVGTDTGLTWEIRDPLGDAYISGLTNVAAWLLLQGPSVLKIPITAIPTPNPTTGSSLIRGENVVQATTGAEGEFHGYVFDGVSTGYMVIYPRVRGTGVGVYGWDSSYVITGGISGAVVTQSGSTIEYRMQMLLVKSANYSQGCINFGCFDPVGEATDMFDAPARLSLVSATLPPGASANYPVHAWVVLGTSVNGGQYWSGGTNAGNCGNTQVICADCIEEQYWSADGSWTIATAFQDNSTYRAGDHNGHGFQRLDDTEDGDVCPFVSLGFNEDSVYAGGRTGRAAQSGPNYPIFHLSLGGGTASPDTGWGSSVVSVVYGWGNRGGAANDSFRGFEGGLIMGTNKVYSYSGGYYAPMMYLNYFYVDSRQTSLVPVKVREPIWIISQSSFKMRKGTLRWWSVVQGGESGDTHDNKTLIQLSSVLAPVVVGPWDGTTTPILWA